MATAADLIGAWELERWAPVPDDGGPAAFPLGEDARGLILYTPDGHVSAMLARAVATGEGPFGDAFAYAGRVEVRDGAVFHSIRVSTDPALVGVTSTRRIALSGDRLTLSGPDFSTGTGRTQRIDWRRARP